MSDISGNQERITQDEEDEAFLMGQMAQSTGDYFALLGRDEEAKGEYLAAITAYDQIMSSFRDFSGFQNNKQNLLKNISNLQDKLKGKLSEHQQIREQIIKMLTNDENISVPIYSSDANFLLSVNIVDSVAKNLLISFATSPDFMTKIEKAFGYTVYSEKVEKFFKTWVNEDFSNFPQIEIRSSVEMCGALGAFAVANNKIYLSEELFIQNTKNLYRDRVIGVLLEEYGSYIDSQINISDPPGDEGEIFATLVEKNQLNQAENATSEAENDRLTISLEDQFKKYQLNLVKNVTKNNTIVSDIVDEYVDVCNYQPLCPVVLLLDTSASMSGEPIDALNRGLAILKETLQQDKVASTKVEVAIVTFGDKHLIQDFTTVDQVILPWLVACGSTPMGQAIELALDLLERRKMKYKENGIQYYNPWIFLVTDGEPTDNWNNAAQRVRDAAMNNKFRFFAVGILNANMDILRSISPHNPPMFLNQLNFSSMFKWVAASLKQVSTSRIGEEVKLPPIVWGEV